MAARARKKGESFPKYRAALKEEEKALRLRFRVSKLFFNARPYGRVNLASKYSPPEWVWAGKGQTFRRGRESKTRPEAVV